MNPGSKGGVLVRACPLRQLAEGAERPGSLALDLDRTAQVAPYGSDEE